MNIILSKCTNIALVLAFLFISIMASSSSTVSAGTDSPYGLKAKVKSYGIELKWKAPTENADAVTGYQILRRERSTEPSLLVLVADTGSTVTRFRDFDVGYGLTYNYRVKAVRSGVISNQSGWVRVTMKDPNSAQGNLSVGQTIEGELHNRSDKDWYRLELEGGQNYEIRAKGVVSGYTLYMPIITGLYDENKNRIGSCRNYCCNTGKYSLNSKMRFTAPEDGVFYITLNSQGRGKGTYSVRLRERN